MLFFYPNLRDVGETINIIYGDEIMTENVLFRGGTVNELFDENELPAVRSILNLRSGPDKEFDGFNQFHIPAVDSVENYLTQNGQVRNWANRALSSLSGENTFPLLVHCTAGKDRTGVIIALILLAIGVDKEHVIEEYMQTNGVKTSNNIVQAIDGIGQPSSYIYDQNIIGKLKLWLLIN